MKTSFSLPTPLRELSYRVIPGRRRVRKILSDLEPLSLGIENAQHRLSEAINRGNAFAYVRPGGTESEGMYTYANSRLSRSWLRSRVRYSRFFRDHIRDFSGVQYRDLGELDYFSYRYLTATLGADLLGYGDFAPGALGVALSRARTGQSVVRYDHVEPMRAAARGFEPWTLSLKARKVLVVHPFVKSISHQYSKKAEISGLARIMPDFDIRVLCPPVSLENSREQSWKANFDSLLEEVVSIDFDVAIIGAGGYGAPLAYEVARTNRVAIHTAGATQLMFGVRGVRWDDDEEMKGIIDETWIRPFEDELVPGIRAIDGGSYH